jgi:Protein of unknown function (DUF998)
VSDGRSPLGARTEVRRVRARGERWLLACGAIGPPLFVVVFLVEGATRRHYDAWRHPVSSLSIGDLGWMQMTNFIVTGTLMIAFAVGLRSPLRREGGGIWAPVLIGLFGVGLIGAGIFTADPISGFPPGTPVIAEVRSGHGRLHDLFGVPVFFGLPVACGVLARRFARTGRRGWAAYSIGTGVAFLACFLLAGAGFGQNAVLMSVGGLLQRVTIVIGWTWLAALAVHWLRLPRSPLAGAPPGS